MGVTAADQDKVACVGNCVLHALVLARETRPCEGAHEDVTGNRSFPSIPHQYGCPKQRRALPNKAPMLSSMPDH